MSNNNRQTNYDRRGKEKVILFFPTPAFQHYRLEIAMPLAVVAAPLEGKYELVIIDERLRKDYESELLSHLDDAICVGISSFTGYQIKCGITMAESIRKANPEVPIIWGGYHPSLFPEQTCESEACDIVCFGQGDVALREIVEKLVAGGPPDGVAGTAYWSPNGIVKNEPRPLLNINETMRTPYHLLDVNGTIELNQRYNGETRRITEYYSSQGCPGACAYCADAGIYQRHWSGLKAERVVEEVTDLVHTYNLEQINFSDANFFANQQRVKQICEGFIEQKLNIRWVASARADAFHRYKPEILELIRDSGCQRVIIGAESASEPVLKLINKGATAEDVVKTTKVLRDYNLGATYDFITGFPHPPGTPAMETARDLLQFIEGLKNIYPDVRTKIFVFTPYPGTPLYDLAVEYGMEEPQSLEEWADYNPATRKESLWAEQWEREMVEKVNGFYLPFAYPNRHMRYKLQNGGKRWAFKTMHLAAMARAKTGFYSLPVEWILYKKFKKDTFEPIV